MQTLKNKIMDTQPTPGNQTPPLNPTEAEYQYALAQLLFHQAKVDHYIKITRAYLYKIEKQRL